MEILIGVLCAIFTYIFIYRDAIKKEKQIAEIKEQISIMKDEVTEIILGQLKEINRKIDNQFSEYNKRIGALETTVAVIKTKIAGRAAFFSAISSGLVVGLYKLIEIL